MCQLVLEIPHLTQQLLKVYLAYHAPNTMCIMFSVLARQLIEVKLDTTAVSYESISCTFACVDGGVAHQQHV